MSFFHSTAKRIPTYFDYNSFILCRPSKNYKVNSAINIIKGKNPVIYDIGIRKDMLTLVNKALNSINKKPEDVKFTVISHVHFDHCMNLIHLNKFFPNCKVILHKNAYNTLVNLERSNDDESVKQYNKKISKYIINFWRLLLRTRFLSKNIVYICEDNALVPCSDLKLKIIYTPGHSLGHICLHDCTNKILFLGDHLPFTPWLDISSSSLDYMIYSIKKLLKLNSKEVHYSVRNHGNLKDNWREVYPWEIEKERFENFLQLILNTIDKIVALLKRNPLSVEEIAIKVLKSKDYRDYSSFLNTFIILPIYTWIICYLLKLEKENIIKRIGKKWSAI